MSDAGGAAKFAGALKKLAVPWVALPLGAVLILAAALCTYPPLWQTEYAAAPDAAFFAEAAAQVNLNTATAAELTILPGIGPAKAQAIIAFREENGPFAAIEDIMQVAGIGEKTFAALQDDICV